MWVSTGTLCQTSIAIGENDDVIVICVCYKLVRPCAHDIVILFADSANYKVIPVVFHIHRSLSDWMV